jgi:hypothetical protein
MADGPFPASKGAVRNFVPIRKFTNVPSFIRDAHVHFL